jgi:threo-3-hydroxy-L-aspartate ammonia-lyase
MVNTLVTLDDIKAAAERIRSVARRTPIVEVGWPGSETAGPTLFLKCENLQPMGAFKMRGAYNMLAQLAPEARSRGVITYSSGNHGQAVALAARMLGVPAVIVMPETAPAVKVEGARGYGAEVIFEGTTSAHRKQRAEAEAARRRLTMVPPFDHEWIIAGQGTAGLEILEQCPNVRTVYIQVGGGGLIAGTSAALKLSRPGLRVIAVEPAGAPKMKSSAEAGQPIALEKTSSIADGLLPVRPGDLTFAHVKQFVDAFVTVEDSAIAAAVKWLFRHAKIVAEPSGAITVAAVMQAGAPPEDGATVAVISGGNVAPQDYARYITQ